MAVIIKQTNRMDVRWKLGAILDCANLSYGCQDVRAITAMGAEMMWIVQHFCNLPYPKNTDICTWFGDTAKMIVAEIAEYVPLAKAG